MQPSNNVVMAASLALQVQVTLRYNKRDHTQAEILDKS